MKRWFATVLLLMLVGSLVPGATHAASTVTVTLQVTDTAGSPVDSVIQGDVFLVKLYVQGPNTVYLSGSAVDFYYDAQLLQPLETDSNTQPGPLAIQGLTTGQYYVSQPANALASPPRHSLVGLRLGSYATTGVALDGSVQLASSLAFKAVSTGTVSFTVVTPPTTPLQGDVVIKLADQNGQPVSASTGATHSLSIQPSTGDLALWLTIPGRTSHAGGDVYVLDSNGTSIGNGATGSDGSVLIQSIPPGTYDVLVGSSPFLHMKVTGVPITEGATTTLGTSATPYLTVRPGNIQDPAADADVIFLEDLAALARTWGQTSTSPGWLPAADLNADSSIDLMDLNLLATYWGQAGATHASPSEGTVLPYTAPTQ